MAKSVSSATINKLMKHTEKIKQMNIGMIDETPILMDVKTHLSISEFMKFVMEISNLQYTEENEFKPEYSSIQFDIALCEYYTNLTLSNKLEDKYFQIHQLGIKRKILDVIEDTEQYKSLVTCILEAQAHVRQSKTGLGGIMEAVTKLMKNVDLGTLLGELIKGDNGEVALELDEHLRGLLGQTPGVVLSTSENVVSFPVLDGEV